MHTFTHSHNASNARVETADLQRTIMDFDYIVEGDLDDPSKQKTLFFWVDTVSFLLLD